MEEPAPIASVDVTVHSIVSPCKNGTVSVSETSELGTQATVQAYVTVGFHHRDPMRLHRRVLKLSPPLHLEVESLNRSLKNDCSSSLQRPCKSRHPNHLLPIRYRYC